METKKNPAYDIHRHRPALFTIGLICSLTIVIMAFKWKVELQKPDIQRLDTTLAAFEYTIPVTDHKPDAPKPHVNVVRFPQNFIETEAERASTEIEIDFTDPTVDERVTLGVMLIDLPVEAEPQGPVVIAERMPEPEGGYETFYKILKKSLRYPDRARRITIEGKVFVEFIVNEDGQLSNLKIIKGIGAGCDEEAIRVLKLTKWKPGKQRGVPVKVRMVQPIHFALNR